MLSNGIFIKRKRPVFKKEKNPSYNWERRCNNGRFSGWNKQSHQANEKIL